MLKFIAFFLSWLSLTSVFAQGDSARVEVLILQESSEGKPFPLTSTSITFFEKGQPIFSSLTNDSGYLVFETYFKYDLEYSFWIDSLPTKKIIITHAFDTLHKRVYNCEILLLKPCNLRSNRYAQCKEKLYRLSPISSVQEFNALNEELDSVCRQNYYWHYLNSMNAMKIGDIESSRTSACVIIEGLISDRNTLENEIFTIRIELICFIQRAQARENKNKNEFEFWHSQLKQFRSSCGTGRIANYKKAASIMSEKHTTICNERKARKYGSQRGKRIISRERYGRLR